MTKLEREVWKLNFVPFDVLEDACRAWRDYGLWPGQRKWDALVAKDDHRIPLWRQKVQAALSATRKV